MYRYYASYFNIPFYSDSPEVYLLPFDTVLKMGDRVREDEALALSVARSIGLPVPRLLSYGDDGPGTPGSIWMSRVEGEPLNEQWSKMSESEQHTVIGEVHECLIRMREFQSPTAPLISSLCNRDIRSFRAPSGIIPRSEDESQFIEYFLRERGPSHFNGEQEREASAALIKRILTIPHSIVLVHGDLHRHNIMVKDNHVSGIIDWECAGWMPEYWDFASVLRFNFSWRNTWFDGMRAGPAFRYHLELECDKEVLRTTGDSFPF